MAFDKTVSNGESVGQCGQDRFRSLYFICESVKAMENLARYIIRAPFFQGSMQYLADEGRVTYSVKGGNDRKVFDAPEWLVAMCSHVVILPGISFQR